MFRGLPMNSNYHLDIAYIAGLFDGEGSLTYKKYKEKKKSGTYDCRRIRMEMSMTDKNVIELVHVCKKLWPYATVKLHAIEKVIDHYEPDIQELDDTVIDLALERELRNDR